MHAPPNFAIIGATLEGVITSWNSGAQRLFGYSAREAIGRPVSILVPPDRLKEIAETRSRLIRDETVELLGTVRLGKCGAPLDVSITSSPIKDAEGKVVAALSITVDRTEHNGELQAMQLRADELAALQASLLDITAPHALPTLLHTIVERATQLLGTQSGGMYLCDPARGEVRCVVSYNTPQDYTGTILKYGEGAAGTVAKTGQPLIIDDYRLWRERAAHFDKDQPFAAVLSAPMIWNEQVTGVIHVLRDVEGCPFTQADLALLTMFASHAVIAVENARLFEGAQTEISEREQAEKALIESEQRYRSLVEWSSDAIAIHQQGKFVYINQAGARLIGAQDPQELVGKPVLDIVHPDDRQKVIQRLRQTAAGEAVPLIEEKFIKLDGTPIDVEVVAIPFTHQGQPATQVFVRDITDRKRAAEALAAAEHRFRALVENAPDAITLLGADGTVIYDSPAAPGLLGYEAAEFIGRNALALVHPDDLPYVNSILEHVVQEPSTQSSCLLRLQHKNGSWRWIEAAPRNLLAEPSVQAVVINYRDVTERVRAEAENTALLQIMQGAAVTDDLHAFLGLIRQSLGTVLDAENFFVVFHDKTTGLFEEVFAVDKYDAPMPPSKLERSITSYVYRTGEALLLTQAKFEELCARGEVELVGTKQAAWLGAPLQTSGETIGVIAVQNHEDPGCYTERDKNFLASVGAQVALATERRRAEAELASSEGELTALFAAMTDVVVVYDADGRYIKIAPTNPVSLFRPREEMLGRTVHEVLPEETADYVVAKIRQAIQAGNVVAGEYALQIGGQDRWFACSVSRLTENTAVWVAHDISNRKQAELLQQAVFHIASAVLTTVSLDELYAEIHRIISGVMHAENFYIALYDAEQDLLSFPYFRDAVDEADLDELHPGKGLTAYVLRTGRSLLCTQAVHDELERRGEVVLLGAPSSIWLGVPLNIQGRTIGAMVVQHYSDPSAYGLREQQMLEFVSAQVAVALERKKAQVELASSEGELTALFAAMTDVVVVYDADGRYIKIAPTSPVSLFRPREEMLGKTVHEVLPEQTADYVVAKVREAIQTGEIVTGEYPLQINGQDKWFAGSVSRLTENTAMWMAHDISNRRQAADALRASEASLQAILQSTADGLLAINGEGQVLLANDRFVEMWRIPQVVMATRDDSAFLQHVLDQLTEPQEFLTKVQELYGSDEASFDTLHFKDGRIFERRSRPLLLQARSRGRVWSFDDVTNRKQAEQLLQQRARELQVLYETSLEVSAQTSLEPLLSSIVQRAASLLGTDGGGLYLMQPDGQTLRQAFGLNAPRDYVGVTLKLGEGLSGMVAQSGKSMQVEDYQNWSGRPEAFRGAPFRRALAIPLRVQDRVIGVIEAADSAKTGTFSESELRLGSLFAGQAALAIESARLHEQDRARSRDFATLYESSLAISSNLDLDLVLKTVVEQVAGALKTDECAVSFLDKARDAVVVMADYSATAPEALDAPGTIYLLNDYPVTRQVLESRQPVLLMRDDPRCDPAELDMLERGAMRAVLMLPLAARGEVTGLMEVYLKEANPHVITDSEILLAQTLSAQTAIYLENSRLFDRAQRRLQKTMALHRIDQAITGSMDTSLILKVVLDEIVSQVVAGAAAVLLYNPITHTLDYASGSGFHTEALQHTRLPMGQGYAGRAALGRQIVHVSNLQGRKTDFLRSTTFSQEGFVTYFGIPMVAKGELKGVLEVFHRTPFEADGEWTSFLETLAGQAATAIDSTALFEGLQRSNIQLRMAYDATIEGWSRAMDLRDRETEGHTQRVSDLAVELGRLFALPEESLLHLRRGALLHDMGKMGVPDAVLQKPGPLTDDEWVAMKRHPTLAYEMLAPIQYLQPALEIPYCHHEKWDGSGYPRGLKGEQIPLAARIFAVIDVYDALTSDRPYRKAWSQEKTREHIRSQSGTHFDPHVAETFLNMPTAPTLP